MSFEVMNADDRLVHGEAKGVGHARPDQQSAGESRALRIRDSVELGEFALRFAEYALCQRQHAPNMVARSELRHDPAVGFMQRDLRMERMRKQTTASVIYGEAGFVARCLYAENLHGVADARAF